MRSLPRLSMIAAVEVGGSLCEMHRLRERLLMHAMMARPWCGAVSHPTTIFVQLPYEATIEKILAGIQTVLADGA